MHRSIARRLLTAFLTIAAVAPWLLSGIGSASAVTDASGLQAVTDGAAGALVADAQARELRSIYPAEWGAPRPDGVAILPDGSSTLVVGDDQRLVKIAPTEDLIGTLDLAAGVDVRDIGIDPVSGRFVVEDANELVWGRISSTTSTRSDELADLGLVAPAGLTFDAAGNLLTLDAASETIVNLGRPTTSLDTTPTETRLPTGVGFATEGLAYNPDDGLVYVTNVARDKLYGIDAQGAIRATHDLSGVGIRDLTGMSFGPSADPTDDPSTTNLYVADAGDATTLGRVAEVSLAAPQALAAPTVSATFIRQTEHLDVEPGEPRPGGRHVPYRPPRPAPDRRLRGRREHRRRLPRGEPVGDDQGRGRPADGHDGRVHQRADGTRVRSGHDDGVHLDRLGQRSRSTWCAQVGTAGTGRATTTGRCSGRRSTG